MANRILVVARWYPSFDSPISGIFVADLVRALVGAGHDVIVASFDPLHIRGPAGTKRDRAARAETAWAAATAGLDTLSNPRSWGAGVPVARLPVLRTWARTGVLDETEWVERHSEALLSFGRALADRWPLDIIHAQTGIPDGLAADRLARELSVPLLVSEHDSTLPARLEGNGALADRYLTLTDASRHRAVATVSPALGARIATALGPNVRLGLLPSPVAVRSFVICPRSDVLATGRLL